MNVKWERRDGTALARVEGRIDGANFSEFQRVLEAGLEPDADSVVLDFEHVAFISSAGLRVVLMLGKQLRKRGAQLALFSLGCGSFSSASRRRSMGLLRAVWQELLDPSKAG